MDSCMQVQERLYTWVRAAAGSRQGGALLGSVGGGAAKAGSWAGCACKLQEPSRLTMGEPRERGLGTETRSGSNGKLVGRISLLLGVEDI